MKRLVICGTLAAILPLLAGCAGLFGQGSREVPEERTERVQPPRPGLSPQELQAGECGLFLWTRRESPEFIYFSKAGTETALIWLDKEEHALSRTGVGGEVFGQQLTEQYFVMADGRQVELEMTPGDMLISGQRIPEVLVRVIDGEGFKTVIPAAGVTVCQPTE